MYIQNSHDSNFTGNVVSSNGFDGIYFYQSNNNVLDGNVVTNGRNGIVVYSSDGDVVLGNDLSGNDQGILLSLSHGSEVRQNNVSVNDHGIQVSSSVNIRVAGNNVVGNVNEGIYLVLSSNITVLSNIVSDNGKAIVLMDSNGNSVVANNVSKCGDGLSLEESMRNVVSNNTFSFGNNHGIVLSVSNNNTLSNNDAFNNTVGIGLRENSENNTMSGNVMYSNTVGLILNSSDGNSVYSNMLTGNTDGIKVLNSRNNTLELNIVSSNIGTGIYTSFSNSNTLIHNRFSDNSQRPSSENSSNSWDNGIEGNFWGYEGLVDADRNGIADSPFVLGNGDRDSFPLMAPYIQQIALIDDRPFAVGIVCNSSVSDFRYFRSPESENFTTRISFRVGEFTGLGFCRITILRALIQPPFDVTVDNSPPLYQSIVGSNGTRNWLYFSFSYIAGDVRIANAPPSPPFWTEYWFWGLTVLALVVMVLAFSVFLFYRRLGSYRKTIEEVERKLKERESSPLEVARRQFGADVERRSLKIGKFEEKYGIKIRPRESLDDIFRGLKKKEEKEEEKDVVNS
jgi:parallel beta-helix repeat protein